MGDPLQEATPDLRQPGWARRVEHGEGIATLHYPDGTIRVEHLCTRTRDGLTILCAPALQLHAEAGHVVLDVEPLTISLSVGCGDCGLHGFIVKGVWRGC